MTLRTDSRRRSLALSGLAIVGALCVSMPALAEGDRLAMLASLAKGEWTIKGRGGTVERRICVRSGTELVQIMHRDAGCSQFVVEDGAARVTVQYTCQGNGYARTSVRKETAGLVQLESQGIHNGMPFEITAEGRRTGPC
jgi:hypothetical protein